MKKEEKHLNDLGKVSLPDIWGKGHGQAENETWN